MKFGFIRVDFLELNGIFKYFPGGIVIEMKIIAKIVELKIELSRYLINLTWKSINTKQREKQKLLKDRILETYIHLFPEEVYSATLTFTNRKL